MDFATHTPLNRHALPLGEAAFWHPSMTWALLGRRGESAVLDPALAARSRCLGLYVLARLLQGGGQVLLVTKNPETRALLRRLPPELWTPGLSLMTGAWIGGTLTNWKQVSRSVVSFASFQRHFAGLMHREAMDFPQYRKRRGLFQGLVDPHGGTVPRRLPQALFLLETQGQEAALREAARLHIPVIACVDATTDLRGIRLPVLLQSQRLSEIYGCLQQVARLVRALSQSSASRQSFTKVSASRQSFTKVSASRQSFTKVSASRQARHAGRAGSPRGRQGRGHGAQRRA
jgi:ribosomal protein S2